MFHSCENMAESAAIFGLVNLFLLFIGKESTNVAALLGAHIGSKKVLLSYKY